jgi:hypothetical protein
MLNNLFRKTNSASFSLGGIGFFLAFLFVHPQEHFTQAFLKAVGLFLILGLLVFQQKKERIINSYGSYNLAFAVCLFLIPRQNFNYTALFMIFCLVLVFQNTLLSIQFKKSIKNLFNMTFLISLMMFIEPLMSLFYLMPLISFADKRYQNLKHLTAFITPIVAIPLTFFAVVFTFKLDYVFPSVVVKGLISLQSLTWGELLWIGFILLVFSFSFNRAVRTRIRNLAVGSSFLLVCFFLGLFIPFFQVESLFEMWVLLFLPIAYFTGIYFETVTSKSANRLLILLVIVRGSLFFLE